MWHERRGLSWHTAADFAASSSAIAAVELAFVLGPTLIALMALLQLGVIYILQANFDIAFRQYSDALTYSFSSTSNAGSASTAAQGYEWMCAAMGQVGLLDCTTVGTLKRLYVDVRNLSTEENRTARAYVTGTSPNFQFGGTNTGYGSSTDKWNMPAVGSGESRVARAYYLLPVPFEFFLAAWANIRGEGHVIIRGSIYGKPAASGVPPFSGGKPNLP